LDLNLETLKHDILDYLTASDFAVFRSYPGGLETLPVISWDTERFPDYRMFLDTAQKLGVKLVLFASRELEEVEVTDAAEELEDADMSREDKREYENRIRDAKRNIGSVCALELAFTYDSHVYAYEARPDWYEDFLEACDELDAMIAGIGDVEDDGHDSLGGFYSNN
jgi:hypothetical protein